MPDPIRMGLFGGTFDPPHVGHLMVAEAAREQLALDRVIWMPSARPPHKAVGTSAEHRLAMTRLATADHPAFEVSDRELHRAGRSFTADTLDALSADHPGARWWLIVGEDSLASFPTWREPERIVTRARLAVYRRGDGVVWKGSPFAKYVDWIDAPRVDVSSTDLRARLADRRSVEGLVSDDVAAYARVHRLYRGANDN